MKRKDNRKPEGLRPIQITKNYLKYAHGSALVEWGNNIILCSAMIENRVPPWLEGKGKGWITAEYAMLPASTSQRTKRERQKIGGRTFEIQRLIGRSLRAVADLKNLGEKSVFVDCDVIQADGGTRCASITGAYIALSEAVKSLKSNSPILKDSVSAVSVGMVKDAYLLDLDYSEDVLAQVDMNVVVTGSGEFVEVQGTGEEATFSNQELKKMLALALKGIKHVKKIQNDALAHS